jgi:hypothetical protein
VTTNDIWKLYESWSQLEVTQLSSTQADITAICDLRQEVNSGGFDRYFSYWGGDSAPRALCALPQLLGQDWAEILSDAMTVFGSTYPLRSDDRLAILLTDDNTEHQLQALDKRYNALEASTNADELLARHVRDSS